MDCKSNGKNADNSDYICNPKTGIWVRKDGPTGRKILDGSGQPPVQPVIGKKECKSSAKNATDPAYICNPETGVWVKKDGPTGRKIQSSGKVKSPVKGKALVQGKKECNPNGKNAKSPNYICNNETGLWVKRDGPTGRRILNSRQKPTSQRHTSVKRKSVSFQRPTSTRPKSPKSIPMHETCKLTNVNEPVTHVYYYKNPSGLQNAHVKTHDVIGIFTSKTYAQTVCKCANDNFNKHGWTLIKPYQVLNYVLNSHIRRLDSYDANNQGETVYIVHGMVRSIKPRANYVYKILQCIGHCTLKEVTVKGKKIKVQKFKYKLNTLFATNVLTDYKIDKPYEPKSLYHDQVYKTLDKIPYLDNNGIGYQVWDNVDNMKGTCVWHVLSKAMNTPIPKIAEKIKNMSTQVSPHMITSNPNTTNLDVYNKLINYEEKQFGVYPRHLCYVPKFAKEYAVVTFFVSKSGRKYTSVSPFVQCVAPRTKPTKIIFTCSIKDKVTGGGHHVLVTIKGVKGWSFNVKDVQHVLNILPTDCRSKLL